MEHPKFEEELISQIELEKRKKKSQQVIKSKNAYFKAKGYQYQNKYFERNPEVSIYHCSKKRAERAGLEFTITREDIVIPEYCPLLGVKITHERGKGRVQTNASLDRIDSTKGYIPGNVQVISNLANQMKTDATPEQLIAFANGILRVYGTKIDNQ